MLLFASLALAGPFVLSVSEEKPMGVGGGWARVFLNDDDATAWRFLWSAGGDYAMLPMGADLTVTDMGRTNLTGRTNLVDHGIARCPDGSFLHAASANLDTWNDSAYAFRLDADLVLTAESTIAERDGSTPHNDLAVVCTGVVDGVAFSGIGTDPLFYPVAEDGTVGGVRYLEEGPQMMGGVMAWDDERDVLLAINFDRGQLRIARYDADLALVEVRDVPDATEGMLRGYWAQGLMRIGDTWMLAHMARDEADGWAADEGDLWLTFFDADWNVLDRAQITENTPPTGGMRPGIARRGDQLLVTYDKLVQPHLYDVRLDLAALGVVGAEDSGFVPDDGDDTGDSGGPVGTDPTPACGCVSGDAPAAAGLLGVLALLGVRRRR